MYKQKGGTMKKKKASIPGSMGAFSVERKKKAIQNRNKKMIGTAATSRKKAKKKMISTYKTPKKSKGLMYGKGNTMKYQRGGYLGESKMLHNASKDVGLKNTDYATFTGYGKDALSKPAILTQVRNSGLGQESINEISRYNKDATFGNKRAYSKDGSTVLNRLFDNTGKYYNKTSANGRINLGKLGSHRVTGEVGNRNYTRNNNTLSVNTNKQGNFSIGAGGEGLKRDLSFAEKKQLRTDNPNLKWDFGKKMPSATIKPATALATTTKPLQPVQPVKPTFKPL